MAFRLKQELNLYTPDFDFMGTVTGFSSLRWRRQIFDLGEVELNGEATMDLLRVLGAETFIHREGYDELGIIDGRTLGESAEDGKGLQAIGQLSNSILGRAVLTSEYDISTMPVEVAMRTIVAAELPRVYGRIVLGDLQGFTETIDAPAVADRNVFDVLAALARASGVLFRLRPDIPGRQFVFETYKGQDRSIEQSENPRVVFSDLDGTLANPRYEQVIRGSKNFAYVVGENDVRVTVDRVNGGVRRECVVDARSVKQGKLTATQYRAQLVQNGNEYLDGRTPAENFEAEAQLDNSHVYREEWDIGDIVTVHKSEWDILLGSRIPEAEEVYDEQTGEVGSVTPVFGSPLPEKFNLG